MAQVFISHSQRDRENIHFFLEVFAGTKVKPHLEEFENLPPEGATADKIARDIDSSNAVFVLLSENVEALSHTRDWVTWECGVARNKEIWVFEHVESLGRVRVVVPHFAHYALYDHTGEWRNYLRLIIDSYDDSHVLRTLAATTGGGALIDEKARARGALAGLAVGAGLLLLSSLSKPSFGHHVRCHKCPATYRIHRFGNFRCAVCNADSYVDAAAFLELSNSSNAT